MANPEAPLSKVSFDNNADLMVFADRHEYRTRSRAGYIVLGLLLLGLCVFVCVQLVVAPLKAAASDPSDRTAQYVVAALSGTCAGFLVVFALWCFRTNPWVLVSPAGLAFRNRIRMFGPRAGDLLVQFSDIDDIDTDSEVNQGGRFDLRPIGRVYWLTIHSDSRGDLRLPWSTSQRDVAVRFGDAFLASMQEMADRSRSDAVPEPVLEGSG